MFQDIKNAFLKKKKMREMDIKHIHLNDPPSLEVMNLINTVVDAGYDPSYGDLVVYTHEQNKRANILDKIKANNGYMLNVVLSLDMRTVCFSWLKGDKRHNEKIPAFLAYWKNEFGLYQIISERWILNDLFYIDLGEDENSVSKNDILLSEIEVMKNFFELKILTQNGIRTDRVHVKERKPCK